MNNKKFLTLGSLFDGSGGFPLAAEMCGITPVWASEIDPFCVQVTSKRFPSMRHLGDITKINGGSITPVNIITFGSPCQDLSVAGNRAGLDGSRSSLFLEAVRIFKEMRETTNGIYPNVVVWENVPGAYSSHKGEDFRRVLEEIAGIAETPPCQFLDLRAGNGTLAGALWETVTALPGAPWTPNFGESPKDVKMNQIGSDIMAGIGDGIISGVTAVKEKISAAGEKIMNAFKDFFGIHSPSTKMKEEVGYNLADGTAEGFIEQMERNVDDMNAAVPKDYTIGVNITDEKSAKKAIDTIVTDYKKGWLSQQQADALTVSVYRDCEQQKIKITEYALEKITAARKDVSDKNREQLGKNLKSEITAYEKQIEELQKSIQKTADNLTESYKSMYTFEKDDDGNIISAKVTNKMREATKELDNFNAEIEKLQERGISSGLLNQLDGMSKDEGIAVAEYWNTLSDKQLKALEKNWEKYQRSANQLSERLHAEETEKAARDMLENINAVITDSSAVLDDMGLQIMAGLREGMTGTAANSQIKDICDSIISRFKNYFGIASPSKVMKKEVGLNLADGVGIGFTEQMSKISADMQKAVPTHFDLDVEVDSAATARKRHMANGGSDRGGFSYTQIINSPKALDTATINRQTRQGLQLASVIR